MGGIGIGNSGLDIGSRFDNVFVVGHLIDTNPFSENDELLRKIREGHVLHGFHEEIPDKSIKSVNMSERVLFWYRQCTSNIRSVQYYTAPSPHYGNNVAASFDVYALRV